MATDPLEYEGDLLEFDQFFGPEQQGPNGERFNVNVSVRGESLKGLQGSGDRDGFYASLVTDRRDAHPDLEVDNIGIAGEPGKLFHYATRPYPENPVLDQSQAFLLVDEVAWAVTLSVVQGTRDDWLPTFSVMLESFRPK